METEISRMSLNEYREWQATHLKHSSSPTQAGIDLDTLYDCLVEGLNVQVIVSPGGYFSGHIMMILAEAKKFQVDHVYHHQYQNSKTGKVHTIATVISEKRLNTEFAAVLADIVVHLNE